MAVEIERKYLVNKELLENEIKNIKPFRITQGYMFNDKNKGVVRIRKKNRIAYLTIKSANTGISRQEFEYKIPLRDANDMLANVTEKIEKLRYEIIVGEHTWEVDIFQGGLAGLILAEIELKDENEEFELPKWVEKEVSDDPEYYNSNLIKRLKTKEA